MNKKLADSLTEKWDSKKVQNLIKENDIETLKYLATYNYDIFYEDKSLIYPINILFSVINDSFSTPAKNLYKYLSSHQTNISGSELETIYEKFITDGNISIDAKSDLFSMMIKSDVGGFKDLAIKKLGVLIDHLTSQNIDEIFPQLFDFIGDLSKNYLAFGDNYIKLKNYVVKSNNTEYMVRFVENTHMYEPDIEDRMSKNGYKPIRYFAALNEVTNLTVSDVVNMFKKTNSIDEKSQILMLNKAKEVRVQLLEEVVKSDKYSNGDISKLLSNIDVDKKTVAKLFIENYNLRSDLVINLVKKQQLKLDVNDLQVDDYLSSIIDGVIKTGDNILFGSIIDQCKTKGAQNKIIQSTIKTNNAELMLQLIFSSDWATNNQSLLTAFKNCANKNQLKQYQELLDKQNVNLINDSQEKLKEVVKNPDLSKTDKANLGMETLNAGVDENLKDKVSNDIMVNKLSPKLIKTIQMGEYKQIVEGINKEYADHMFKLDSSSKNGIFIALARRVQGLEIESAYQFLYPIFVEMFDKGIVDENFIYTGMQQKLQRLPAFSRTVVKLAATKNLSLNQYTNQLCLLGVSTQNFKTYLNSIVEFCNTNQAGEQLKLIVAKNFNPTLSSQLFIDILNDEKCAKIVENLSNINSKFCTNILSTIKDFNVLTKTKNFNRLPQDAKDALQMYYFLVNKNA